MSAESECIFQFQNGIQRWHKQNSWCLLFDIHYSLLTVHCSQAHKSCQNTFEGKATTTTKCWLFLFPKFIFFICRLSKSRNESKNAKCSVKIVFLFGFRPRTIFLLFFFCFIIVFCHHFISFGRSCWTICIATIIYLRYAMLYAVDLTKPNDIQENEWDKWYSQK